jgi:hypothetical protein
MFSSSAGREREKERREREGRTFFGAVEMELDGVGRGHEGFGEEGVEDGEEDGGARAVVICGERVSEDISSARGKGTRE